MKSRYDEALEEAVDMSPKPLHKTINSYYSKAKVFNALQEQKDQKAKNETIKANASKTIKEKLSTRSIRPLKTQMIQSVNNRLDGR